MYYRVQVYLDGLRDQTHHADGNYADLPKATEAVRHTLTEQAVSEVRVVKIGGNLGDST